MALVVPTPGETASLYWEKPRIHLIIKMHLNYTTVRMSHDPLTFIIEIPNPGKTVFILKWGQRPTLIQHDIWCPWTWRETLLSQHSALGLYPTWGSVMFDCISSEQTYKMLTSRLKSLACHVIGSTHISAWGHHDLETFPILLAHTVRGIPPTKGN